MTRAPAFKLSVLTTLLAAGCGGLTSVDGHDAPTLFEVRGQVTGELAGDVTGELRAALSWSVYDRELIDCVAAVDVDGPLDWVVDEADAQVAEALDRCLTFSARGRRETASVPLQPSLPASFSIPVDVLPDAAVLSGDDDARLGIAGVLIYTDDNGNSRYDETPRGAPAFLDRVHGTSLPTTDDAERVTYLIYREGAVSPLWKLFVALYGCSEPPAGFSTVTVDLNQTSGAIACVVDDRPIDVALGDFKSLGCAVDPGSDEMTRPGATGLPADSTAICDSGDLFVTTNPESVCPSFSFYTLFGCDLTTEASCRATFWDLQNTPPGWWPCSEGARTLFNVVEPAFATDGQDARLFTLRFRNGTPIVPVDQLAVTIAAGETQVTLSGAALRLVDNDGNGAFNTGDLLHVGELDNEITTATVPAGTYSVGIVGLDGAEVFGAWVPFALPGVTLIEVSAVDAPAVVTDGIDDVAILTFTGPESAAPRPFAGLSGRAYIGGELPITLTAHVHVDANNDGLFGPGDQVMVRDVVEGEGPFDSLSAEALRSFGGTLYVSLATDVGVDSPVDLAYATVEVE